MDQLWDDSGKQKNADPKNLDVKVKVRVGERNESLVFPLRSLR